MKHLIALSIITIFLISCAQEQPTPAVKGNENSRFVENPDKATDKVYCRERPELCTQQYDPVVGSDGRQYSNGCMACSNTGVEWFVKK